MNAEQFSNTPGGWADRIVATVGNDLERTANLAHYDFVNACSAMQLAAMLRAEQALLDVADFTQPGPTRTVVPDWALAQLAASDRVKDSLTLIVANGTPGTADYVLANDLLDEYRAVS